MTATEGEVDDSETTTTDEVMTATEGEVVESETTTASYHKQQQQVKL